MPLQQSAWITKYGRVVAFGFNDTAAAPTGNFPLAPVKALAGTPTIYRHGVPVSLSAPAWYPASGDQPNVFYLLQCGGVSRVDVYKGGSGYTSPTATAVGGTGSGCVLGKPVVSNGVIAWIPVVSPGDYTVPPTIVIADPAGKGALAAPIMSGASPSDAFTYDAPAGWATTSLGGAPAATGATVVNNAGRPEAAVGGFRCFAQAPKLIAGVNVGSQPSYPGGVTATVKNKFFNTSSTWNIYGTGRMTVGANNAPVSWTDPRSTEPYIWVDGPASTDNLDSMGAPGRPGKWAYAYTDPFVNTPQATNTNISARPGVAGATPINASGPHVGTPTPVVVDPRDVVITDGQLSAITATHTDFGAGWQAATAVVNRGSATGPVIAQPIVSGGTITGFTVICPGSGFTATPEVLVWGLAVDGNTVSGIYDVEYVDNPTTWELDVSFYVAQIEGRWNLSDLNVVAPHCSTREAQPIDVADPLATDDGVLQAFAGPDGRGTVGILRFMDATLGYGGACASVTAADLLPSTDVAWYQPKTESVSFQFARYFNTDPASTAYAWSSPKVYGLQPFFYAGPDAFGRFAPVAAGDDGRFIYADGTATKQRNAVVELRSTTPHGLTSKDYQVYCTDAAAGVTFTNTSGPYKPTILNGGYCWVTGPNTIVVPLYIPDQTANAPAGAYPQTVVGNAEIDLTAAGKAPGWQVFAEQAPSRVPYDYPARFAQQLGPATMLWVNIPRFAAGDLAYEVGRQTARYAAKNPILVELGDEPWNGAFPDQPWWQSFSNLASFAPAGTQVWDAYRSTGKAGGDTWIYGLHLALSQHALNQFKAGFAAAGGNAANVKHVANVQWSYNFSAQLVRDALNQPNLAVEVDYLAVGPYMGQPTDQPVLDAFAPCGSFRGAVGWPVDALNDMTRHRMAYGASYQSYWSALKSACDRPVVCYEGGCQVPAPNVPNQNQLAHDCFADPSYADVVYAWYLACQQGDQAVAGTGAAAACYFSAYSWPDEPSLWALAFSSSQPPGPGTNNRYATMQGGYPADGRDHNGGPGANVSPGLYGLQAWVAAAAPGPAPTPTPTPATMPPAGRHRWFVRPSRPTLRLAR